MDVYGNNEAGSRNRCCSGKTRIIKYTVRQSYKENDFILTNIEVLSMKQCMPSM